MAHTPRIFFMIAALAGGVLATPAQADDTRPDAVVTGRHYEVPPPRSDYLRLNTAHQATLEPIVVRPVGGVAQVSPVVPVTPRTGGTIQVTPGSSLALNQPGLPSGAREEALGTTAAPLQPVGNVPTQPIAQLSSTVSASPVTAPAPAGREVEAGMPPPRVFQTMKQAANAAPTAPVTGVFAPTGPKVADTSWKGRALALITAYPMALPGCAMFLVLLAFLFKRSRVNRRDHAAGQ